MLCVSFRPPCLQLRWGAQTRLRRCYHGDGGFGIVLHTDESMYYACLSTAYDGPWLQGSAGVHVDPQFGPEFFNKQILTRNFFLEGKPRLGYSYLRILLSQGTSVRKARNMSIRKKAGIMGSMYVCIYTLLLSTTSRR